MRNETVDWRKYFKNIVCSIDISAIIKETSLFVIWHLYNSFAEQPNHITNSVEKSNLSHISLTYGNLIIKVFENEVIFYKKPDFTDNFNLIILKVVEEVQMKNLTQIKLIELWERYGK
jgi:hypothetical protein